MAVSSTTVLAQMARFLIFLSDAPSYWFSLNKSCDEEFHLAKQFGMDKENFEALLIAGNLAQYRGKSLCLCILADQWTSFFGGHHFSDLSPHPPSFEFEQKKIRINNQSEITYVVRIGCLIGRLPLKFEKQLKMNRNPPRMNSLRIQQQAFGWATDLAIANLRANVNRAPVQAPSAKEIVRTAEEPTPMKQIPARDMKQIGGQEQMMYPLLRKIYGDAFDPLNEKTKKMIEPLLLEIICLKVEGRIETYECDG
jgi:hypothetical protein